MELAAIIKQYQSSFLEKYQASLFPGQIQAIHAIQRCRTPDSGELYIQCTQCEQAHWKPMSCGHRSCPKCQNHEASQWLERQQAKLLPVEYFMATFTLPKGLRSLVYYHQKKVYSILFQCVASTLKDFGLNPDKLGAEMGMTAVLHTHSRQLEFHPHIHVVLPGGGIDKQRRQWKKLKGQFLFNEFALAKVFRARFIQAINEAGFYLPKGLPNKWVVDCTHVGKGLPALKYLSRYLYRGVLSEKDIVANQDGQVTFQYTESKTGKIQYRTLKGADFLNLLFQHILPKGFRRVRDYGFLHPNAKKLLSLVQLILNVIVQVFTQRPKPVFKCPKCHSPMAILKFRRPNQSG
jgi:Zn finger protein HypA/HybF involved in hydrogenase expression